MSQENQYIPSFEEFQSDRNRQSYGVYINPKRIISNLIRLWYVVLLSVFLATAVAWALNRYTKKLYHIQADIMIKEVQEVSGAEILYNNVLINPYRNYYNELHFLKSTPMLEQVVNELNLNITFNREGNIKDSEVYRKLPVNVKLLSQPIRTNYSYKFVIIDNNTFELSPLDNLKLSSNKVRYHYGEIIEQGEFKFKIDVEKEADFSQILGREYVLKITTPNQIASEYRSRLNVKWAEEGASVINIGINGYTVQKEIDFLQRLIEVYTDYDVERKNEASSRAISFINQQLKTTGDSLSVVESQLEKFKDENYVTNLSGEASHVFSLLEDSERLKSELVVRENYYSYLEKYIENNKNLDQIILPTSVGVQDPVLTSLIDKMVEIQLQAKTINRELKQKNPRSGILEKQIHDIRNNIVGSISELRKTDSIKKKQLNSVIYQYEVKLKRLPATERALVAIQRNYNLLEGTYIFLMQKMAEASISRSATVSDIVTVNPPARSGGPIKPKPMENYAIAILLGLLLPITYVLLNEIFNDKVQSKDDITRVTDIPFSGAIGHNKLDNSLVVSRKPRSSMAESFRSLRSNLNYFTGQQDKKVYLVTSSVAGEGKTFTSINLGTVFALSGKKTLLVGADLRKPKIHIDFNLENDIGLSNYLSGQTSFNEIVKHTEVENLDIIGAGPVPPNPSELIMRPDMARFIEDSKKEYDIVIIDSPPLAVVTDAFILTLHTDHNLFIVRQNYTPMSTLKNLGDVQSEGKLGNLSIVLNDIQISRLGYGYNYGYNYGYGYRYYSRYGYGNGNKGYYED